MKSPTFITPDSDLTNRQRLKPRKTPNSPIRITQDADFRIVQSKVIRLRRELLLFDVLANVELVRLLPAIGEDELGVRVQTKTDAANTAAGSGLHEATCWASSCFMPEDEGVDETLFHIFANINSCCFSIRKTRLCCHPLRG
mgnify:CR=1 FL=1